MSASQITLDATGPTADRVRALIVHLIGCAPGEASDDALFGEDLGCDSIDQLEIVMAVEEDFRVEINDDDAVGMTTISAIVRWIDKNTQAAA